MRFTSNNNRILINNTNNKNTCNIFKISSLPTLL
eukprot:UN07220